MNKLARETGIRFIVLFGSQTKERKEGSDFDIAVSTLKELDADNYTKILSGLAEALNVPDSKIDLANLNKANILLRYEITSQGVLLYGDETEYEELKAFAFRDYVDAESLFKLEELLIHKRQKLIKEKLKKQ